MREWSGRVRVHAMLLAATILGADACIATPVPRSLLLVTADDLDAGSTGWMECARYLMAAQSTALPRT